MKRYPVYKPSGIEWIGDIPEHWKKNRLKTASEIVNGATPSSSESSFWEGDIIWVTPEDLSKIENIFISDSRRKITKKGYESCGTTTVPIGSVILTTRAPIGNIGIAGKEVCFNQGCKAIVPNRSVIDDTYLYFFLHSGMDELRSLGRGTTFLELSNQSLSDYAILLPPLSEQQVITSYLDKKTTLIDETITKKQKLIELLQEERTALINKAVTCGLDDTVKMKESGVEWLSNIPVHWEIKKLGLVSDITRLAGYEYTEYWEPSEDGEIIALRGFNIGSNELQKLDNVERINEALSQRLVRSRLFKNDIVFPCVGTIGKAYLVKEDNRYHINQNIAKISPSKEMDPTFLLFFLLSDLCKYQVFYYNTSDAQPSVLVGNLRRFKVPVPSLSEQTSIASFLTIQTLKIDGTISITNKEIEFLQEYRTALINEVVTGKVCVL